MTQSDIVNAKQEMNTHLGLDLLKAHLQSVLDNLDEDNSFEILTYKLALSEANRIQQLLYDGIIEEEEISKMLINPDKFEEIFDNI